MIVHRTNAGEFVIKAQDGTGRTLAGPFPTHAAAWRWIDRQTGETVSKAEDRAEFIWDRAVDRSFG